MEQSNDRQELQILLIEDNSADVFLIKDHLKHSGTNFILSHCTRLSEALDLLSNPLYDVVLLDLGLPDSWGLNTLKAIKSIKMQAAVIVLTGLDDEKFALASLKEGAQDYIVKDNLNADNIIHAIKFGIERKKHQKELERLNAELESKVQERTKDLKELLATKDKFFGIIAHDLKNPFSGLIGASELLLYHGDEFDKKKLRGITELMHNSAKNIFIMLENLLEWARTQTGNISFNPEKIYVKEIVSENITNIKAFADHKGVSISTNDMNGLMLLGDRNMINTIIRNLLNNAVKFTSKEGKVKISAVKSSDSIIFSIKDSGIGIRQEDINKLFRIDVKFSRQGTASETGTGLGLILCKEFIEKHKGEIWVESKENEGSEFKFIIPVK